MTTTTTKAPQHLAHRDRSRSETARKSRRDPGFLTDGDDRATKSGVSHLPF